MINNNNKNKTKIDMDFNKSYGLQLVKEDVNVNSINGLTDQLKHTHITDDFTPSINLSRSPNSLHLNPETPPLYNNTLNKYNHLTPTQHNHTTNTNNNNTNNGYMASNPFVFPQSTPSPTKTHNNKPPNLFGTITDTPNSTPLHDLSDNNTNYKTPDTNSTPFKPTDRYKKQPTYTNSEYNKYRPSVHGNYGNSNNNNSNKSTTTTTTSSSSTPSTGLYFNFNKTNTTTTPTTPTTNTNGNVNTYYQKKPSIYDSPPTSPSTPTTTTTTNNNSTPFSFGNTNITRGNPTPTTSTTSTPIGNRPGLFQSAALNPTTSSFSSTTVVNENRVTDTSPQPVYVPKLPTPVVDRNQHLNAMERVEDLLEEKLKTLAIEETDPSYETIKEMLREEISENIKVILDNQTAYLNNLDYYGYEEDEYEDEDLTYERLVELEDVKVGVTDEQKKHIKEYKYDRIRISQNSDCQRCTICLEDFENKQLVKELIECNHYFHSECIDPWLRDHKLCPMCRREV